MPIVHFSVKWWRTLHQKATVFNPQLARKIDGVMALTLWIGVIAFTILYVYLLDRRYRLAALEDEHGGARGRRRDRRAHRRAATAIPGPGGGRLMRLAVQLADPDYGWAYVVVGLDAHRRRPRRVLRAGRGAHPARRAVAPAGVRAVTTTLRDPPRPRRRSDRASRSDTLHRRRRRRARSRWSRSSS